MNDMFTRSSDHADGLGCGWMWSATDVAKHTRKEKVENSPTKLFETVHISELGHPQRVGKN
jgi:hypothetical protein